MLKLMACIPTQQGLIYVEIFGPRSNLAVFQPSGNWSMLRFIVCVLTQRARVYVDVCGLCSNLRGLVYVKIDGMMCSNLAGAGLC